MSTYRLVTSDLQVVEVGESLTTRCPLLLRTGMNDLHLKRCTALVLRRVLEWCDHHHNADPAADDTVPVVEVHRPFTQGEILIVLVGGLFVKIERVGFYKYSTRVATHQSIKAFCRHSSSDATVYPSKTS